MSLSPKVTPAEKPKKSESEEQAARVRRQYEYQLLSKKFGDWPDASLEREAAFNSEVKRYWELKKLSRQPGW